MRHRNSLVQRLLCKSAGASVVAAALAGGTLPLAAGDTPLVPAKRPPSKASDAAASAPRANVRIVSVPSECPTDENEAMTAVRAFVDPNTGEFRAPTPEEQEAFTRMLAPRAARRAEAARTVTPQANGVFSLELGEDAMMDAVARKDADGKAVFSCTPRSETPKALTKPLPAKKGDAGIEEK